MRVFVTGHRGYIGAHLVELLKTAGHTVTGCDLDLFAGCAWGELTPVDVELQQDVRLLSPRDLEGHDCVMHLAAISNDPMGDLDPNLTLSVNRDGTLHLAAVAKEAGVPRFLFSSSCSVYGKGQKLDLSEDDPLAPLTAYAQSKIESEARLSKLADRDFSPVYLRNATAYGDSPMLRVDLVVNNLLASAVTSGRIAIRSDGKPWRPLIHCRDIARAFVAFADAPREVVHNLPVNVGADEENYQVKDVGDAIQHLLPEASIEYTGEVGEDPRNYRVKFDRLRHVLPDFELEYNVPRGAAELLDAMRAKGFSAADFQGDRFVRLRTLRHRLDQLATGSAR